MYQDFDEASAAVQPARVSALVRALSPRFSGFLVPHGDEHQAALERLSWLTGFTGSGDGDRAGEERGVVRRRPLHAASDVSRPTLRSSRCW
jgi:hypothetical protein